MARRLFSYPVSLAVVIAVLIAATGGWIAWWNYRSGVANVRALATDLFDRVAHETAEGTAAFLGSAPPAASTLRNLAALDPPDLDDAGAGGDALARRFVAMLVANPSFAWVSYSNAQGVFIGATRDGDKVTVNQSKLVAGKTERVEHPVARDGTWGDAVHASDTHYDPRTRPFYAVATPEGAWAPPYVFAGAPVPGITYAIANRRGGVFTIDFSLARLTELARELQFSEHGKVVVLADDTTVVAHPSAPLVTPVAKPGDEPSLIRADAIGDPAVRSALASGGDGFELDGTPYFARSVPIALPGTKPWRVLVYAPEADFTAGLRGRVISSLVISLVAVVIAVVIAWVLARRVSGPLVVLADEMQRAGDLRLDDDDPERGSMFREIQYMNTALMKMKGGLRSFSRYVPRDLVRALVASGQDAVLAGETRELTVFFSDLAGFTTLSESRTPDELVKLLGVYFDDMSQIIADERGTLDKYLGDGIMAFWGAPVSLADHARRACIAALRSHRRVRELAASGLPLAVRIGVATGDVLVGNIGSHERMNYTVMGDTANLAARLESLNKQYGTELMITESTRLAAGDAIVARPVDVVAVKGKSRGVRVYELLATATDASDTDHALVKHATDALDAYLARRFTDAAAAWSEVLALRPGDSAATTMRDRALAHAASPPGDDWTGVMVATEK